LQRRRARFNGVLRLPLRRGRDAPVAAAAVVHGTTVDTRNVADFAAAKVSAVGPWDGQATGKT